MIIFFELALTAEPKDEIAEEAIDEDDDDGSAIMNIDYIIIHR